MKTTGPALMFVLFVLLACKSNDNKTETTQATVATVAAPAPAPAPGCAKDTDCANGRICTDGKCVDRADPTMVSTKSGKLPTKKESKSLGKGRKGGSGASRPSSGSHKTSAKTLASTRTKASDSDPCDSVDDGAAECDGNKIYFCDDGDLFFLDCNSAAKGAKLSSGTCFETDTSVDCMGCDTNDDGETACCDFSLTVCCDDTNCYDPKD